MKSILNLMLLLEQCWFSAFSFVCPARPNSCAKLIILYGILVSFFFFSLIWVLGQSFLFCIMGFGRAFYLLWYEFRAAWSSFLLSSSWVLGCPFFVLRSGFWAAFSSPETWFFGRPKNAWIMNEFWAGLFISLVSSVRGGTGQDSLLFPWFLIILYPGYRS